MPIFMKYTNPLNYISLPLVKPRVSFGDHLNLSKAGGTMYVTQISMILEIGGTTYVPQKQFWITALLGQYCIVSCVFAVAASISNAVSTMVENDDTLAAKEGDLPIFDIDIVN